MTNESVELKACPYCEEGTLDIYPSGVMECSKRCGFNWVPNTRTPEAQWISVEDAPNTNGHYQIWDNGYGEGLFHNGEWKSTDRPVKNAMGVQCLRATIHPTHWMPLPQKPTKG